MKPRPTSLIIICSLILAACGTGAELNEDDEQAVHVAMELPPIETKADSIAYRIMEAHGGLETWQEIQYVRFDFGTESEEDKTVYRRHLWDRYHNNYRVEWESGEDSTVVALFNTDTREGRAYINGADVDSTMENGLLRRAYRSFINDTYWLMAPIKLLDPGVRRSYVRDSSNARFDVITLTYEDVGLTPDDQFWFWMDKETGMLTRWAYLLQGRKDRAPTVWNWEECEPFETEAGTVKLCPRKSGRGRSLMTDNIALPPSVQEGAFENPNPIL